jgi:DNA-binding NarL/FixJ family response regulator
VTNILIADDHEIVREGLTQLLDKIPYAKVIGQAKNGMETVNMCNKLKPDIIIMDIGMPVLNGIEATRKILAKNKYTKVIILSMYMDNDTVMSALEAGISGFVLKNDTSRELIEAVNAVVRRKSYLSPEISSKILERIQNKNIRKRSNLYTLTHREKHILQLIAEGYTTKEIANLLNISFHTAKTHRNHIMEKLELHSVAELTKYALSNKITSSEK